MKKLLLFSLFAFFSMSMLFAEGNNTKWSSNPFEHKMFIENKGQFEVPGLENSKVLFGIHNGKYKIYFCKDGLYYKIEKVFPAKKNKFVDFFSSEKEDHFLFKSEYIHFKYQNSNADVQLITEDPSETYFNYSSNRNTGRKAISGAKAFKKLIYKNIYPGIDAEYVFHEKEGIKYSFIVAPGADPKQIQLSIDGQQNSFLDGDGNLHIQGEHAEILEHKPVSWNANIDLNQKAQELKSNFILEKNKFSTLLTFNLDEYDGSKKLIIDPWQIIPNDLSGTLKGFEIKRGENGNAYVYGGFNPYNLVKYDTQGKMLWVYECYGNDFAGDLAVDPQGTSYVCTYGSMSKVKTNGEEEFEMAGPIREMWRLDFNCDYTKLVLGGGETGGTFFEFNKTKKTFNPPKNVTGNEIRSMSMAPNGYFYCLTLTTVVTGNTFIGADKTYKLKFSTPSNHPITYNGALYANSVSQARCPINGVVADQNYVYTTDGGILTKWTLNGTRIVDQIVPGGTVEGNGGIAVDACGNIYVGGKNSIIKFDSTLTEVAQFPTQGTVYDVSLGLNGEVFACGFAFAGAYAASACADVPCCPVINLGFSEVLPDCNTANGSLTAVALGGVAPFKYKWNTTPVQTTSKAINLKSGQYICEITDANGCVGIDTFFLSSKSGLKMELDSSKNASCFGASDGVAYVTGAGGSGTLTYEWNTTPPQYSRVLSNVPAGDYICTVKDANGCAVDIEVTLTEPLEFTSNIDKQKNLDCKGDSTAEAAVNGVGGTGPYKYIWNTNPPQNTSMATGLKAGEYECTITDNNGCTIVQKVTIPDKDGMTILLQGDANCEGSELGSIDATVAGGTPPYTYSWETNPIQTSSRAAGLPKGNYRVRVTDNSGCSLWSEMYTLDCPQILIPDGFNPKSKSENNRTFKPTMKLYKNYSMKIFDRWGAEIFQSTDSSLGWDGKHIKTKLDCPVGVYIYQISVDDLNGRKLNFHGHFSLTQ